jgi:ribosome biogenesis protein Tsr3
LNIELLELYKNQEDPNEILKIEKDYFPNLY